MSVYAIGDIQGCFDELLKMLNLIKFDPEKDQMWFTGDLVNRGPKSLETLRFVKQLGHAAVTVLGNHDLHLLAIAAGNKKHSNKNTLQSILIADDHDELMDWLKHRPVMHYDTTLKYALIHAGIPPQWDLTKALKCAKELEAVLQGQDCKTFLNHMYGNKPLQWSEDLEGWERLRFITNCFTRLRFCSKKGTLNLKFKSTPGTQPKGDYPWFAIPNRKTKKDKIIFGHWSTLGYMDDHNVISLDSGCLWGGHLTVQQLDQEKQLFKLPCPKA